MAGLEEARGRPEAAEALLHVRQGRVREALAPAESAAALAVHEPRNAYLQALILQRLGRGQEAEATLTRLLERHPQHRDRGNLATAERSASAAVALNRSDREAAALLAQLRVALDRRR